MKYSFKIGFNKAIVGILTVASAAITFTAFSDVTIWGLIENYLKPALGSLTVGGALLMALNYFKFRSNNK